MHLAPGVSIHSPSQEVNTGAWDFTAAASQGDFQIIQAHPFVSQAGKQLGAAGALHNHWCSLDENLQAVSVSV